MAKKSFIEKIKLVMEQLLTYPIMITFVWAWLIGTIIFGVDKEEKNKLKEIYFKVLKFSISILVGTIIITITTVNMIFKGISDEEL